MLKIKPVRESFTNMYQFITKNKLVRNSVRNIKFIWKEIYLWLRFDSKIVQLILIIFLSFAIKIRVRKISLL